MNKTCILFTLLLAVFSCDKDDKLKHRPLSVLNQLDGDGGLTYPESLSKWNELKRLHDNSYVYQTMFTSFGGHGNITELRVENGVITSRGYEEYAIDQDGSHRIIDSYRETAENLGIHEKGALLLTIDDLYETCAGDYLTVDTENNTIHFETAEVGLMTVCGFVPDGCEDDCLTGVRIHAFEWLE